jgi:[CysO sulfur-carrier protein]-S-L-cysteine hydrolase
LLRTDEDVMRIPSHIRDDMVAHARAQLPNEACGFLAGTSGRVERFYPVANRDGSPFTYLMDPAEQQRAQDDMDARGLDLLGVFHSHTGTAAFPSPTDVSRAYWPDRDPLSGEHMLIFPETSYVIVSLADPDHPDVRSFRIVCEQEVRIE